MQMSYLIAQLLKELLFAQRRSIESFTLTCFIMSLAVLFVTSVVFILNNFVFNAD